MNLPNLSGKATLDIAEFRQGVKNIRADLTAVQELAKRAGTIRITADLSATKDIQKATRAIRDAIQESIPSDMQRRIDETFGAFSFGANKAQASAAVFEAQASALRARIDELDRAVKITRADFQAGFGDAAPEETAKLSQEMARLSRELEKVGAEAKENFGEYSREAQKVANANRLAGTTAAAARGEITRLGLASQVKLGVGSALQQYGSQAGFAANNIFSLAKASDTARISQALFYKTMEKSGTTADAANSAVTKLQDTLGVTADAAREGIRGLTRQGFTLEQAFTTLQGAGASALAAGQDASAGIEAVNDAVASGSSARLNAISISENLSTYFQKEAKARGVTVDALDKQARAQAVVNLITAATTDEVGDLSAILGGVSGNLSGTSRALDEAGKKLGEAFIPLMTNGIRVVTKFLDVFNDLPEAGKNVVAILGASAVAVGFLAGPVSNLARGYATIRDGLKGVKAASDGLAAVSTTLSENAANAAINADAYTNLASKAKAFYASSAASLTTYISSTLLATGATNVFSKAFLTAVANTTLFTTAIGAVTVGLVAATAGVAALAAGVGYFSVKLIKETQAIYDAVDAGNQASFDNTMKRVSALNKEGTELSRAQARILLAQERLRAAEEGNIVGTTLFGERIIKKDEEAIKSAQAALVDARGEMVLLYTEAQRRGALNLKLTEEQTKAVKELRDTLAGRAFTLKLDGLSDLEADLARTGKDFDDLREKFKKPFVVGGKLMDPGQTPDLRLGLEGIDTQKAAEVASIRKRYADEALADAKISAIAVQDAEIAAMRDGENKKVALRKQEIAAVQRDADERIAALSDFPEQQKQLEEDTRSIIAAKRRGWAEEDRLLVVANGRRVAAAENRAGAAVIESMEDGQAKREAIRAQELESLRRDVAERVAALAGDSGGQGRVQAAGDREIDAKLQQQNRARVAEARETAQLVTDAETSASDGVISAMEDGLAKREAIRTKELEALRKSIARRVEALAGDPEAQNDVLDSGQREIASKIAEQNQQRIKDARELQKQVVDAENRARDGAIAAMEDGLEKREAIRARDLEALRDNIAKRVEALNDDPEAQKSVQASGEREINSKLLEQAQQRVKEEQSAQDQVAQARKSARDAEIAAIADEGQRRAAERQKEIEGIQEAADKRIEVLRGYPALAAEVQAQADRQIQAINQKNAAEDAAEATVRAQRIADAYLKAQDAQIKAEQAGRDNQAAQYDLDLARRLAAVKGNAVQSAQIEAEGQRERARLAAEGAQLQLSQDQQRLAATRDRELSNTKLSADERRAIWRTYYADLATLSAGFQAGEKERLAQQEQDARAAAEAVRVAYIQTADKPIEKSESRTQELQQAKDLAETDGEILRINQQIAVERDLQIKGLGSQLEGLSNVRLTTEERAAVEEKIRGLQNDQIVALRDQEASGAALRQSTLDRLENEAEYAEKVAKTTQELEAARAAQLAVAQARLRELDGLIAGEGREVQRNALLDRRLGLLGQIADLTQREANAPIEADERKLRLYQAQAEVKLIASGQQDNEIAKSQLTLQIAAQELLLANQRLAVAGNQLAIEAAQNQQAAARLAFAQAYAASLKADQKAARPGGGGGGGVGSYSMEEQRKAEEAARQRAFDLRREALELRQQEQEDLRRPQDRENEARKRKLDDLRREVSARTELQQRQQDDLRRELDLQNKLQDVAEARVTALGQIRGLADDAVGSAEQELGLTRERLILLDGQIKQGGQDSAGRAELLQRRIDLLLKEDEQQRKLIETRRAAARLTDELVLAEERLSRSLAGGAAEGSKVEQATRQIIDTRRALAAAERDYAEAKAAYDRVPTIASTEKLKSATGGLVGAVTGHRSAIKGLAAEYRTLVGQMDGVRDAGDKLRKVAYGDATPFRSSRERERLTAIAERRDAAQRELAKALQSGQADQIAAAAEELTRQQERYNKQVEALKANGLTVSRTGDRETKRLADAVDTLGIQYDKDAVGLEQRARIADREAENAMRISAAAEQFDRGTASLVGAIQGTFAEVAASLIQAGKDQDARLIVERGMQAEAAAQEKVERAQDDTRRKEDREREDSRRELDREQAAAGRVKRERDYREGLAARAGGGGGGGGGSPLPTFDLAEIDRLAAKFAPSKLPETPPINITQNAAQTIGKETAKAIDPLLGRTPGRTAAPQYINFSWGDINVSVPNGQNVAQEVRRALGEAIGDAKRTRAWEGTCQPR